MTETRNMLVKDLIEENYGDIDTSLEFGENNTLSVTMSNLDHKNTSLTFKVKTIVLLNSSELPSLATVDSLKTINRWRNDGIEFNTFLINKCILALNNGYDAEKCDFQVNFLDSRKPTEEQISCYFSEYDDSGMSDDDLEHKSMSFEFFIGIAGLTEDLLSVEIGKVKEFLTPIVELYEEEFCNYQVIEEFFGLYGINCFGKKSIVENFKTRLGVKSDWLYQQQKSLRG